MQLAIAPILAELLIDKLKSQALTESPDLIIPMPLHSKRLQERGFNQALEISRYVARKINITLSSDSCERIKNTPPQTGLSWKARNKNVQNAFRCKTDLSGKHVAVIDDVMTTGATLNALAQQLRKKGAAKISNWIITRARTDQFRTRADLGF
ncbi:ComF family protein [Nitrosomonas aestuarii]|uniref:ComF family protein n=1 Tax=Nitrosomonas aestuarii TaxID=52441 RepID=UPI000D438B96|nr:ComF family protein [Nitrosomonas aestuarii]PTN13058.1 ComF family protein [Nitrosomonas aestuarii]